MERKKELKMLYKEMKPPMGVLMIHSNLRQKCYLEATANVAAKINRYRFQLNHGSHPNQTLQRDWQELGADSFTIEILEHLPYDKDESKTDYTDDLALLEMTWEEKLTQKGWEFY
ncbi:MAG: GIY-YIG nuclease family protein [Dehalobacterium sp.]